MSFPPFPERESSSEYPPAALNGRSPYFIGKPKARRNGHHDSHDDVHMAQSSSGHPNERRPAPNTREQSDNFTGFSLDLSRHDEIVIDEQDSDVEIIPRKKSAISVDSCKGMAFDFSSDPKLNNVRKAVMSIVDPEGKRKGDDRLNAAIACSSSRSMDLVNGKKEKKSKPLERKGLASLNDFRMASGKAIVKEMKQVVPQNENSDESQSDNPFYQSTNFGPKRNAGKRHAPSFNPPPPINSGSSIIKKGLSAMGMTTEGAAKDQVLTGLRAEPSLKHFDENIISLIESEIMSVTTETGWSDVAGLQGAKKALREIVVLPFKRPDVFKGIRAPPKGVLLFGPPGTGKTMIGKCVASQCRATFFNISASSLTSKWVGEGEKLVRALFAVARLKLPSVIFIDEIDSLLSSRSESEHESSRRIKTEFLVQLDGVATNSDERLLVLGATNRPQELDEAARRRFAKRLYIALPQPEARLSIIENLLKDMSNSVRKQDLDRIAELTNGYSGADMRQLCAEASMGPIRDIDNSSTLDIETVEANDIRPITLTDFEEAVRVVRPTVVDQDLVAYEAWDKKFGCLL